ncbi:TlpA family protein disulfide reductase, partial [Parabacteroides sp. OttesenSCG-928-G07]|nr:TlpA family protein disulfide reductase [Parabacteroides sp. OttesenSCG-928-G07]
REHTDAELKKYNETKGFTFPLYPDRERVIFDTFAKSQIPRSYLIGKDGKVLQVSVGYTEEEFREVLKGIEEALKN